MAPALARAARSASISGYSLSKVQRWLHEIALPVIDPQTGLYPADGKWNYRDTAADCYPFLCWAAFILDPSALHGPIRRVLEVEQELCNHLDRIPVPYDWRAGKKIVPTYDEMIFQASEYVKDGLIPIVEVMGKNAWFDRMVAIQEDIWKHARVETPFGSIPSTVMEINGDHLQSLARLFTMTGREEFVVWAERIADHYLAQPGFVPEWLRDHGCEVIGGLGLLLAVQTQTGRPKARAYTDRLRQMFDVILAHGCNEDGFMFNHLTRRDDRNGRLSDGWGYNYVGYLCHDMIAARTTYRRQIERTLLNLRKPAYENFNWEGDHTIDGYADAIEGAIYLLNRVPIPEALTWVDREMARNVVRASEPLPSAKLWGTMKLESNGVRTVLMHALMHTQGVIARPWKRGLELGAAPSAAGLVLVLRSAAGWEGKLHFDFPRHREFMGFAQDWPRMNTLPEWFTVEADRIYDVTDLDPLQTKRCPGKELRDGLFIAVPAGSEKRLLVH